MQILVIILTLGILIHDNLGSEQIIAVSPHLGWLVLGPKILLLGLFAIVCRRTLQNLNSNNIRFLERVRSLARITMIVLFGCDLALGALIHLRNVMGNVVLIDELLVIAPTLGVQVMLWRLYYPIERRLREAMVFRAIDEGQPVYPIWSMSQFLLAQIRHTLAMPGIPILILLGWAEALSKINPARLQIGTWDLTPVLAVMGGALVFLTAPLMMRYLWDTVALPAGPLRQRLLDLCKQYRVGVRELLLWRTFGGMANGAVIGLISPLRFILLTDALLDQMSQEQTEAVMAHEIAHIRKHHFFWLMAGAVGSIALLEYGWTVGLYFLGQWLWEIFPDQQWMSGVTDQNLSIASLVGTVACWALAFGWFSRRLERQADTFAVAHEAESHGHKLIEPTDAAVMADALGQVALLNHIRPQRHSWRHGSIAWRQHYLHQLVGTPAKSLLIDRQVNQMKIAIVLMCVLVGWLYFGGAVQIEAWLALQEIASRR